MDPVKLAWFAGWMRPILAACIGVLGGGIGTGFMVKKTEGRRERALAIKASLLCWFFTGLDIASTLLIPPWWNVILLIPFVAVLVFGMREFDEMQLQIRREESDPATEPDAAPDRGGR